MVVDTRLIDEVTAKRAVFDILIDSHPVTKESHGFRVTPFKIEQLKAPAADAIVCLYASPEVLHARIGKAPDGRVLPSLFEVGLHVQVQAAVATQYSLAVRRSCYLINSDVDPAALIDAGWPILQFAPKSGTEVTVMGSAPTSGR